MLYFFTPRFAPKAGPATSQEAENQTVTTESILNTAKLALTENQKIISIAGGGDTFAAIKKSNQENKFTYISTAGGAFLEWLEGKILPGLKVLEK